MKLITESSPTMLSVANEYGIHENTLGKWKRQYAINPGTAFTGAPSDNGDIEVAHLCRRLDSDVR